MDFPNFEAPDDEIAAFIQYMYDTGILYYTDETKQFVKLNDERLTELHPAEAPAIIQAFNEFAQEEVDQTLLSLMEAGLVEMNINIDNLEESTYSLTEFGMDWVKANSPVEGINESQE